MGPTTTGFSVPTSEQSVSSHDTVVSSGAPSTIVLPAPTKRPRPATAHPGVLTSQDGAPAVPAIVATTTLVDLTESRFNIHSSSSSASASSAASRHLRGETARAKLKMAQALALVAEAEYEVKRADEDIAAGSQAGTIGRLDDVLSEAGSITTPDLLSDGAPRVPLTPLPDELPFSGVFGPTTGSVLGPLVEARALTAQAEVSPPPHEVPLDEVRALTSQDGVSPLPNDGVRALTSQDGVSLLPCVLSPALTTQVGVLTSDVFLNQNMDIFRPLKQGEAIAK